MKVFFKLLAPIIAALIAVPSQAYVAKITKADIHAGGGSCIGNLCRINGKIYDCSGSTCVQIRS